MFCHSQLDAAGAPLKTFQVSKADTVTMPDGTSGCGLRLTGTQHFKPNLLFPVDLTTGKSSVIKATWRSLATHGPHFEKTGDLAASTVVNYGNNKNDRGAVFVLLPQPAKEVCDDGENVEIRLRIALASGWFNGESNGHLLLIAGERHDASKKIDAVGINGTMAHELGHAVHMVLSAVYQAPGLTDGGIGAARQKHGRWYDNARGHYGNHCANGISQADYDDAAKKMAGRNGDCVMYGAGWDGRPTTYCDRCVPFVNAADLSKVTR
jgi:hypothetical protein